MDSKSALNRPNSVPGKAVPLTVGRGQTLSDLDLGEAALAGGIPSLKHEEDVLRGPEIRLLDALKRPLERRQTPLVVGKVQLGVFGDLRKPRAVRNSKILRV
jgi:hypothetical protein